MKWMRRDVRTDLWRYKWLSFIANNQSVILLFRRIYISNGFSLGQVIVIVTGLIIYDSSILTPIDILFYYANEVCCYAII